MNNVRYSNIDLYRFMAAIMIVVYHSGHTTHGATTLHAPGAYLFVDFFAIVTGYLTTKHFSNKLNENKSKEAIKYTISKFSRFIPYTIIVILIDFAINFIDRFLANELHLGNMIEQLLFDIPLLSSGYAYPSVASLWFLSAMLLVFPLFCLFVQSKNRYFIMLVGFLLPLYYFGLTNYQMIREVPHDMLRISADMLIGGGIFELNESIKDYNFNEFFLSCIELLCVGLTVCNALLGWGLTKGILLCFVVEISIMFSGKSFSGKINSRFITFIGKLSMPIYICHWTVGTAIYFFYSRIGLGISMVYFSYYIGTLLFALLIHFIIEKRKFLGTKVFRGCFRTNERRR